jgi:hypothetical protein
MNEKKWLNWTDMASAYVMGQPPQPGLAIKHLTSVLFHFQLTSFISLLFAHSLPRYARPTVLARNEADSLDQH